MKASPSSYRPFDTALTIPCSTAFNLSLSERISSGISIFFSILSNNSLLFTNSLICQLNFNSKADLEYHFIVNVISRPLSFEYLYLNVLLDVIGKLLN